MSSLTTTTINTKDTSTDLTITTGNTSGPAIVVGSSNNVWIRANSSANSFIANSSAVRIPVSMTVNGAVTVSNTLAAGDTTITGTASVSSNTFTLGASSLTANGYSYLPNGLILQWGRVVANTTSGLVTFPVTFPTAILQAVATSNSTTSTVALYGLTASGMTVRSESTASPATLPINYFAIGY